MSLTFDTKEEAIAYAVKNGNFLLFLFPCDKYFLSQAGIMKSNNLNGLNLDLNLMPLTSHGTKTLA